MMNLYDLERLHELDQMERQAKLEYGRVQVTLRSRARANIAKLTLVTNVLALFRLI